MVDASRTKDNKGKGKNKDKKMTPKEYMANLGFVMELINSDPSLQVFIGKVRQYMRDNNNRTPTKAELDELKQGIDWFERFTADQEFARMQQADPRRRADWERSLKLKRDKVKAIGIAAGVQLTDEQIDTIALDARLDQLSDQEIRDRIRPFRDAVIAGGGELVGQAEDFERELLQWSRRNGLKLTGDIVSKYVNNMADGVQSFESVQDDLRRMYLMGQYPAWSDRIQNGFDPADIAGPYRERIAAALEVDEDSIDLNDTLLQRGMQGVGADGKPRVIPMYDFDRMIREDPRWEFTDNAYATYTRVGTDLLKMFGFR
jgi:hypothetical protein